MGRTYMRECKTKTILNSQKFQEIKHVKKKIHEILNKKSGDRSIEDKQILKRYKNIVKMIQSQKKNQTLRKERIMEIEDDINIIQEKCIHLVELIKSSDYIIVYTGAGISTAASIPDYRGPEGVWTKIQNGFVTNVNDLAISEPTYTHMAIAKLVKQGLVKHVVSQNCDGLHRRSGIPKESLSEIHGNMYIEVCKSCKTLYTRTFDVTEKTGLRRHETGRKCHYCPPETGKLIDTIVHFGEKGKLIHPLNWKSAADCAEKADLIICIGSSLKILRKYACLWPKNKKKFKLVIINLQWTPKDSQAAIKINAKCDLVMRKIMPLLNISVDSYQKENDLIYRSNCPLKPEEEETCNRIKLEQLFMNKLAPESVGNLITPGWFGKGIRKK